MITLHLQGQQEKLAPDNPLGVKLPPLYHQMRTLEALRAYDLVMNTYNTGTGKTVASLLYLFDLNGTGKNVLIIAPTNALLAQHAEDIEQFVADYDLNFRVLKMTAADVRALRTAQDTEALPYRPGELLQRLIRNYLEFESGTRRKPIILITNPDIFYYALFFRYDVHDRRNLFERFLTAFDYIVVDEFHYYDSKQLASFLFAFALFDQFGYFEMRGRKVCLLSATPTPQVITYLDRLFGDRWALISPENELPESADYPTTPTLSSLELTLLEGEIQEWGAAHRQMLLDWVVRDHLDGAVISSSLWRINEIYANLRPVLSEERLGRITGPEPPEARKRATGRNLILATPTVDIGYNFAKLGKERQNMDFIICDARHSDELIQRIGRAGRVLGKQGTDEPSVAVALLPPGAAESLSLYQGQALSRLELAQLVTGSDQLPPKHSLYAYIRSHAISECFWPIHQMSKVMPTELHDELDALYRRLKEVFAPGSKRSAGGLRGFFYKFEARERWLNVTKKGLIPFNKSTAQQTADWVQWLDPTQSRPALSELLPHLPHLLGDEAQQHALRDFVVSQVAVTRALFNFREAFQGPSAVIYDPQHLLSSQTVNRYSLFHLLCYYQLSPPLSRRQFRHECAETELQGDFYLQLLKPREPKLSLEFVYDSEDAREHFEKRWCGAPVAPCGFRMQARERGGDILSGALDARIVTALINTPLLTLILPPDDFGAFLARMRGTDLWARRLTVRFPDGTFDDGYRLLVGTAAFHAHAELLGHFLAKERLKPDAIII